MNNHKRIKYDIYKNFRYNKEEHLKNYYLDSNGNAVIGMKLKHISDSFSKYSPSGYEELDSELSNYIDEVVYHIPLKYPLILQFEVGEPEEAEEVRLKQVIKNCYGLRYEDKNLDLQINIMKFLGLFMIGAGLLIFSYFLANSGRGQFFTDLMNIAGTFSVWESVNMFLVQRKSIKFEKLNSGQIATAKIIFINSFNENER